MRLKGYVEDTIKEALGEDITTINDDLKRFQAQKASVREPAKPSPSEVRASEADTFQQNTLPGTPTPEEEAQLDANLRGLALTLKRDGESEEHAFERVKASKYIITFHHDTYWPFYEVKHNYGRVILTINTAHPFFSELYEPVRKMSLPQSTGEEGEGCVSEGQTGPLLALDLLLLSLARTRSRLASTSDETRKLLDNLRREWSETYRTMNT